MNILFLPITRMIVNSTPTIAMPSIYILGVNRLASEESFDDVKWLLDDPIVNFSQSIVDDSIRKNAEFHHKVGLSPKLGNFWIIV